MLKKIRCKVWKIDLFYRWTGGAPKNLPEGGEREGRYVCTHTPNQVLNLTKFYFNQIYILIPNQVLNLINIV
jgi:hypothetical protein